MTNHYIDVTIDSEGLSWRMPGFYGWPTIQDRWLSWQQLRLLAEEGPDPWICIGDFNEVLYASEMLGGERQQWQMNNFRDAVDECGLRDIPYEGYAYTFDNGQVGADNRQCRLDRVMVTGTWLDLFPYSKLFHLDREWSDHSPICVHITRVRSEEDKRMKTFRFEQVWVGEDGCEEAIQRAWLGGDDDIMTTLKRCAAELKEWTGVSIGKVVRDLKRKRERLKRLNEGERRERDVQERKKVVKDIANLIKQEETFWRQRSRALWLRDGDKNTTFFHRKATQRKEKNHISRIVDDNDRVYERTLEIANCAASYFETLFTSSRPNNFSGMMEGVEGRVTSEMNELLTEN
ncbi:uncharacterized protein LOC141641766 [Silene latifolia]|uniref:uncharacterized protein LOC141641766 n=1 Tax=Silene latifolia TaxID=37657 RepID=UPI003D76E090